MYKLFLVLFSYFYFCSKYILIFFNLNKTPRYWPECVHVNSDYMLSIMTQTPTKKL